MGRSAQTKRTSVFMVLIVGMLSAIVACENPVTSITGGHTLDVEVQGEGSVDKSPAESEYDDGTVVTLTASRSSGWVFTGWGGDIDSTANETDVTIDSDTRVTATFEEIQYDLTSESTYTAWSDSYDGSFEIDYTIENSGNTSVTLNSGAYVIYGSEGYSLDDIVVTWDTITFPTTLEPGDTVSAELDGYSEEYVPYSFDLSVQFADEFDNDNSATMGGSFTVY